MIVLVSAPSRTLTLLQRHADGRIRGECWAIETDTLYMWFTYASAPTNRITEMIQLSRDGQHRARTWHWFESERLVKLTLVDERRLNTGH